MSLLFLIVKLRIFFRKYFLFKTIFVILRTVNYSKMSKQKLTKEQEKLARFAKALGHPVRIAILQMLSKQTCCYHGDMSEILPVAKSTLSQHLKELKNAGLIQGTITLPMVKYCINRENWELAKSMFKELFDNIQDKE